MITSRHWPSIRQWVSFGRAPARISFLQFSGKILVRRYGAILILTVSIHCIFNRRSVTNTLLLCLPKKKCSQRKLHQSKTIHIYTYNKTCALCHYYYSKCCMFLSKTHFHTTQFDVGVLQIDQILCFNLKKKSDFSMNGSTYQ